MVAAQAAATIAAMMHGRFFLGMGSGEALNERILGTYWPYAPVRQDMLEEVKGLFNFYESQVLPRFT